MSACTKKDCIGCRNDFYNGKNEYGVQECWSFKSANMVTKFRLHRDVSMGIRSAYHKMRVPDCYHAPGWVFLKEIPDYAK